MADGLTAKPEHAAEMDWDAARQILTDAAKGADDGELFVEARAQGLRQIRHQIEVDDAAFEDPAVELACVIPLDSARRERVFEPGQLE